MKLSYIPAGEFQMGSNEDSDFSYPDERPVHLVYLDAFWIDLTEVKNSQFVQFLNQMGNQTEGGEAWYSYYDSYYYDPLAQVKHSDNKWEVVEGYATYPITDVSWYGARAYCEWAGRRLPTEAEWEKAARGGLVGKRYPWGDEEPVCTPGKINGAVIWECGSFLRTMPVGTFGANGYGLYGMVGNAAEWVADWYSDSYYSNSPYLNPTGPASGTSKVLRGRSYHYYGGSFLRIAIRHYNSAPEYSNFNIGFRCAVSPAP